VGKALVMAERGPWLGAGQRSIGRDRSDGAKDLRFRGADGILEGLQEPGRWAG
jgi:hypothetical protein